MKKSKRYSIPSIKSYTGVVSSLKRRKKIFIIISILLVLIILRIVILVTHKSKKDTIDTSITPVITAKAKIDLIRDVIYLTERLEPESEIKVFAPVSGWLDKLYVDIGSKVYKRQIVASVDRNIVGAEYTRAIVKAPISGEVAKIFLDIGATVAPSVPIMSIVNYDKLKIYANVPEKYVYRVKKDNVVLIKIEELPDVEFVGKIEKISTVIDPMTGSFPVKIVIPNKKHKLKPGLFADIKIVMNMKKSLVIPLDAVAHLEIGKPYVFKITNNIAKKVYIKTGIKEGNKIEIKDGLKKDDNVVITGVEMLRDGVKVKIVENGT